MYDYFVFQSVFFHDFLLFHLLLSSLFSFLRFSLLFSSPLSSLVLSLLLHVSFSSFLVSFSSLFSCLVSPLTCLLLLFSCLLLLSLLLSPFPLFFFFFFFSLSSSLFSLCLLSPCVGGVCVVVCVCVCGVVWCAVWCGTLKTPCVDSKTPPCVDSKRPRVCRQHAHMLFSMCAWCGYTRGRFECTHRERFKSTHGGRRQFSLPKNHARMVITCFRGSPKKLLDLSHVQV